MTEEEIQNDIDRKKREIADYARLAKALRLNSEDVEKRLDMMLDDLNRLLKARK